MMTEDDDDDDDDDADSTCVNQNVENDNDSLILLDSPRILSILIILSPANGIWKGFLAKICRAHSEDVQWLRAVQLIFGAI